MFRLYKNFVKIYVNNIIIYSRTLIEHVKYLQTIFQLFRDKRVNLTFTKFFLTYSFVILLKQRVNNLKMSISTKKIVVIISLRFSHNLRDLKFFLNLIDWFRFSISRYTQRAQSLQERKTTLVKKVFVIESFKKRQINQTRFYEFIHDEIIVFQDLQIVFNSSSFLIHYNKNRRFYIDFDAFKQWEFVVIMYHVLNNSSNDVTYSRIVIQSIIFLNKYLNDVEKNY